MEKTPIRSTHVTSTLLLLAMVHGCSLPGKTGVPTLPAQVPGQMTIVPGTVGGGLIANNAGGLIANNAGGLSGAIRGPGAGLIANNAGGLIANNAGGLIANNAGGYRVRGLQELTAPAKDARVEVIDESGAVLSTASVTADAEGRFTIAGLKPSGPLVFVRASYTAEDGRHVTLFAAAPAPRQAGDRPEVRVDPASSLVAKKVVASVQAGKARIDSFALEAIAEAEAAIGAVMSARSVVAAAIFEPGQAAGTFDHMLEEAPSLAAAAGPITSPQQAAAPAPSAQPPAVALTGAVSLVAGGTQGFADGAGAKFDGPLGLASDAAGNLYVADAANHRIRKVAPDGTVTTLAGGAQGFAEGDGAGARFNLPAGVAVDGAGNVYVADRDNHRIRKIAKSGAVTTLAGGPQGFADGKGGSARFDAPSAVALDGAGNLYVADGRNNRIRKVSPDGTVTTLAGGAAAGFADGVGASGLFNYPAGLALDGAGNVYVADSLNHAVRKVTPAGAVSTVAGDGASGTGGRFHGPWGLAVAADGTLYVGDSNNHRIAKIAPDGTVATLAGGAAGSADGAGAAAGFNLPTGLALAADGSLVVADKLNHRLRRVR